MTGERGHGFSIQLGDYSINDFRGLDPTDVDWDNPRNGRGREE
jgi:hypothetical protein